MGVVLPRIVDTLVLLLVLSMFTFGLVKSARGDLVDALYGDALDYLSPDEVARLRAGLGLDQPLPVQYVGWLGGILRGDFGRIAGGQRPVGEVLLERLPFTASLGLSALVLAVLVGVPLGVAAASRPLSALDLGVRSFIAAATAVPGFWLALGLIIVFSLWLRWLPASGPYSPDRTQPLLLDLTTHALLPVVALAAREAAFFARYTRAAMLEALNSDAIRTAHAKGLTRWRVLWGHAFPQARLPLVTLIGLQLPSIVGGAVVVETVFGWPGMGRLFVDAALKRDFATLAAAMLVVSSLVIIGSLLADIGYGLADPRLARGRSV